MRSSQLVSFKSQWFGLNSDFGTTTAQTGATMPCRHVGYYPGGQKGSTFSEPYLSVVLAAALHFSTVVDCFQQNTLITKRLRILLVGSGVGGAMPKNSRILHILHRLLGFNAGPTARARSRLEVRRLEDKLWGGFSRYALKDLEALICSPASDPEMKSAAHLAVARWYAVEENYQRALENITRDSVFG